jgi:hypothetical protein
MIPGTAVVIAMIAIAVIDDHGASAVARTAAEPQTTDAEGELSCTGCVGQDQDASDGCDSDECDV